MVQEVCVGVDFASEHIQRSEHQAMATGSQAQPSDILRASRTRHSRVARGCPCGCPTEGADLPETRKNNLQFMTQIMQMKGKCRFGENYRYKHRHDAMKTTNIWMSIVHTEPAPH